MRTGLPGTIMLNNQSYQLVPIYKNLQDGSMQTAPSIYNYPHEFMGYMLKPIEHFSGVTEESPKQSKPPIKEDK